MVDQGQYYDLSRKSSEMKSFLQIKSIDRKRSRKYDDEDDGFSLTLGQTKSSQAELLLGQIEKVSSVNPKKWKIES